jgi:type I restriction enzyme S subunit
MREIEIEIPPIKIQQKYVEVYNALVENQKKYEKGLDDLKFSCEAYIERLKKKYPLQKIGRFLRETKEINKDLRISFERGLDKQLGFVKPSAMSDNVDLSKRKVVRYNQFVYPSPHFGEQGTIGLFKDEACIMSQMYTTFKVVDDALLSDYLFLWFRRSEFMRYGFFVSCDSIRDTFDFSKLCEYSCPIPEIPLQRAIVDLFFAYEKRKQINERLKKQIANICHILIKGSIEEALRG